MSCGLPSVCTAVGGVPEILSGGAGFVVPPGQPDKLAEKYCALLEDKALRLSMGQIATQKAQTQYTIRRMGQEFRNLYQGLVK